MIDVCIAIRLPTADHVPLQQWFHTCSWLCLSKSEGTQTSQLSVDCAMHMALWNMTNYYIANCNIRSNGQSLKLPIAICYLLCSYLKPGLTMALIAEHITSSERCSSACEFDSALSHCHFKMWQLQIEFNDRVSMLWNRNCSHWLQYDIFHRRPLRQEWKPQLNWIHKGIFQDRHTFTGMVIYRKWARDQKYM